MKSKFFMDIAPKPVTRIERPDDAAVFCIATSILAECREHDGVNEFSFSDHYNGWDNVIRQAVRIGRIFEEWACHNVRFEELNEVWPYHMEEKFGQCLCQVIRHDELHTFSYQHCKPVAERMLILIRPTEVNPETVPSNSIFTLAPYKYHGIWVFDDASVGLKQEAFVCGADTLIDKLVHARNIEKPEKGFILKFSATRMREFDVRLKRVIEGSDSDNVIGCGNNYVAPELGNHAVWLCPALFQYYQIAPDELYVRVENKPKTTKKGQ